MSRRRSAVHAIAEETTTAIAEAVHRSAPNPTRPRMSDARELMYTAADRERAVVLADMEHLSTKMDRLTEDIRKGPPHEDQRDALREGE